MELKPGKRFRSAVCSTELIVVRAPSSPIDLACGGALMCLPGEEPTGPELDAAHATGTLMGKRYVHDSGLEALCTKPGDGSLSVDGVMLLQRDAKPLPASD